MGDLPTLDNEQAKRTWSSPAFLALLVALATVVLYWPVQDFHFLNYDDDHFVVQSSHVTGGLTKANVQWALGSEPKYYWRPLTWLSLMLDAQLYGPNAGGFHLTNLALHVFSTLFLFAALLNLTGKKWRSAVVAMLFAWHPLHVESVAWIADRVDTLSGFFWMFSLWAYSRYATARQRTALLFYLVSLVAFVFGLMSKPTIVTFPCVLLLLDYWPLDRFRLADVKSILRCACEKIPFFILSLGAGVMAYRQEAGGGLVINIPMSWRLANACLSYARYLLKTIVPTNLSPFYPHPGQWGPWLIAGAVLLLLGITAVVVRLHSRRFLTVGWLFFLGTLVPVIGLVQVGDSSMANRYSYLPLIGIFIALVWATAELLLNFRARKLVGALVLVSLALTARVQLSHWRNSETLFTYALTVTENNFIAENNLGSALMEKSQFEKAEPHLLRAVQIKPNFPVAHGNLAVTETQLKKFPEAEQHFAAAVQLQPDYFSWEYHWANALFKQKKWEPARQRYLAALKLNPDSAETQFQLGTLSFQEHESNKAASYWREAVRLKPEWIEPVNNLSWLLATGTDDSVRNGKEAVAMARRLAVITGLDNFNTLDTLAAALAESGEFTQAANYETRAIQLAESKSAETAKAFTGRLQLYQQRKVYREP